MLLSHGDIHIHLKDNQGRTSFEIAAHLIEATSNEKYSEYKEQYEKIMELLQNSELSDHENKSNSTIVSPLIERYSPDNA